MKAAPAPAAKAPPAPRGSRRGLAVVLVALAAIGLAAGGYIIFSRGHGSATPDAAIDSAPSAPGPPDPATEAIARANELLADNQRAAALDLVLAARKTAPRDPRLALLAGRLYFDKLFWTEGLRQLRDAIRLDPSYRTDPELIKTVLRGFITTPRVDFALAGFLHDEIGDAAKPYLEETAATHHNPVVRNRAAAELKRYP